MVFTRPPVSAPITIPSDLTPGVRHLCLALHCTADNLYDRFFLNLQFWENIFWRFSSSFEFSNQKFSEVPVAFHFRGKNFLCIVYVQKKMPHHTRPMAALLIFTGLNAVLVSTISPVYDFVCFHPYWERRRECRRQTHEAALAKGSGSTWCDEKLRHMDKQSICSVLIFKVQKISQICELKKKLKADDWRSLFFLIIFCLHGQFSFLGGKVQYPKISWKRISIVALFMNCSCFWRTKITF